MVCQYGILRDEINQLELGSIIKQDVILIELKIKFSYGYKLLQRAKKYGYLKKAKYRTYELIRYFPERYTDLKKDSDVPLMERGMIGPSLNTEESSEINDEDIKEPDEILGSAEPEEELTEKDAEELNELTNEVPNNYDDEESEAIKEEVVEDEKEMTREELEKLKEKEKSDEPEGKPRLMDKTIMGMPFWEMRTLMRFCENNHYDIKEIIMINGGQEIRLVNNL